jgi:hypothetical protein
VNMLLELNKFEKRVSIFQDHTRQRYGKENTDPFFEFIKF